ncbi:MAG: hypothetical protein DRG37_06455 [Deltaproteobacteria bacterium]|nr:MAG: hypothetical protein DRG37_06455 [Deltaproteobacteria bacterium]
MVTKKYGEGDKRIGDPNYPEHVRKYMKDRGRSPPSRSKKEKEELRKKREKSDFGGLTPEGPTAGGGHITRKKPDQPIEGLERVKKGKYVDKFVKKEPLGSGILSKYYYWDKRTRELRRGSIHGKIVSVTPKQKEKFETVTRVSAPVKSGDAVGIGYQEEGSLTVKGVRSGEPVSEGLEGAVTTKKYKEVGYYVPEKYIDLKRSETAGEGLALSYMDTGQRYIGPVHLDAGETEYEREHRMLTPEEQMQGYLRKTERPSVRLAKDLKVSQYMTGAVWRPLKFKEPEGPFDWMAIPDIDREIYANLALVGLVAGVETAVEYPINVAKLAYSSVTDPLGTMVRAGKTIGKEASLAVANPLMFTALRAPSYYVSAKMTQIATKPIVKYLKEPINQKIDVKMLQDVKAIRRPSLKTEGGIAFEKSYFVGGEAVYKVIRTYTTRWDRIFRRKPRVEVMAGKIPADTFVNIYKKQAKITYPFKYRVASYQNKFVPTYERALVWTSKRELIMPDGRFALGRTTTDLGADIFVRPDLIGKAPYAGSVYGYSQQIDLSHVIHHEMMHQITKSLDEPFVQGMTRDWGAKIKLNTRAIEESLKKHSVAEVKIISGAKDTGIIDPRTYQIDVLYGELSGTATRVSTAGPAGTTIGGKALTKWYTLPQTDTGTLWSVSKEGISFGKVADGSVTAYTEIHTKIQNIPTVADILSRVKYSASRSTYKSNLMGKGGSRVTSGSGRQASMIEQATKLAVPEVTGTVASKALESIAQKIQIVQTKTGGLAVPIMGAREVQIQKQKQRRVALPQAVSRIGIGQVQIQKQKQRRVALPQAVSRIGIGQVQRTRQKDAIISINKEMMDFGPIAERAVKQITIPATKQIQRRATRGPANIAVEIPKPEIPDITGKFVIDDDKRHKKKKKGKKGRKKPRKPAKYAPTISGALSGVSIAKAPPKRTVWSGLEIRYPVKRKR